MARMGRDRRLLAHRVYATIQMLNTTSSRLASILYTMASGEEVDPFVYEELSDAMVRVAKKLEEIAGELREVGEER
jgi:hypothetical protein